MLHLIATVPLLLTDPIEGSTRFGGTEGPDLTRYFVVCAILIGVTALVAWGFRRLVAGNIKSRAAKRSLETLDVLPLGGKRKLAVVRCYDRTFVLGLGDHEITPVAELDLAQGAAAANVPATKADDAAFAAALEAVRRSMPQKQVARVRKPLNKPVEQAPTVSAEPSTPSKRVVRRKVRKSASKKGAATKSEALSVAAAAQQIAREKQRAREQREQLAAENAAQAAPAVAPQVVAAPAPRPVAAKPPAEQQAVAAQRPQALPRLEGILG